MIWEHARLEARQSSFQAGTEAEVEAWSSRKKASRSLPVVLFCPRQVEEVLQVTWTKL